jgi:hypothetical protein
MDLPTPAGTPAPRVKNELRVKIHPEPADNPARLRSFCQRQKAPRAASARVLVRVGRDTDAGDRSRGGVGA